MEPGIATSMPPSTRAAPRCSHSTAPARPGTAPRRLRVAMPSQRPSSQRLAMTRQMRLPCYAQDSAMIYQVAASI